MNVASELIPTRQSLLSRLKDWNDQESWKVFFDTYWKLIYKAAVGAGLTDAEAQDVVQETVISVLKSMPTFDYDGHKGSFKGWLLRLTGWRIVDQLRKRQQTVQLPQSGTHTSTSTGTVQRLIDGAGLNLAAIWDAEWELNLMEAAIERVKKKVDANQYQIFDLYVFKQWSVSRITKAFKIMPGRVYMAKHRVGTLIKKELEYLRAKPI